MKEDVDAIFIYGSREKGSSELCPYRKIPTRTDSLACFRTIKQWLNPRLVEHHPEEAAYVALTHCWGTVSFLKTQKDTLQSHKECIPLEKLPRNFKDAIYVSKVLGYKYLWIDSLCIIQDSLEDWNEQSNLMGDIYRKADLVIAATHASAAEDGFLTENRFSYREGVVSMASENSHRPTSFKYRLVPPHRNQEGPLDDQGWAYQERLLARRYVSFRSREVVWYCNTAMYCECGSAEVADNHRKYRERSLQVLFSQNTVKELHWRWRLEIVDYYTQRKLTKSKDKLRALKAIATSFREKLGGKYLVGLWERDMIWDLLWTTPCPGSPEEYKAPTWSWVAYKGYTYYPLTNTSGSEISTLVNSSILDASEASDVPQFGSVTLDGKLVQATLIHDPSGEVPGHGGPFVAKVLDAPELNSLVVNPDIFPPTLSGRDSRTASWRPGELEGHPYRVWVFLLVYPLDGVICGIILETSIEHPSAYWRIGLATFYLIERKKVYSIS
ncbi:heterokaryon incompatibility protein-domain-containing protein [Hypoxylon sp. FL1284]|nr:heterokaryon incompatibility protein-domain-containing protein [Hypoxylon sp. FL1284]